MKVLRTDNKEIIRRLVDAGDRLDTAAMAALIAPNAVVHTLFDATDPLTGEIVGFESEFDAEKMERRVANEQKMFTEEHSTLDQIFDVGEDMVLSIGTETATHKSGKKVTSRYMELDRISNGKVVEIWALGDRLGYWQQLGLVPPTSELMKKLEEL